MTAAVVDIVEAVDRAQWRAWLAAHGDNASEAWLVLGRGGSPTPRVAHREAIEEAVAGGWIDSLARRRDDDSWLLRFTPRNPRSSWSLVNHEIVATLTAQGLMTPRGQAAVDLAKRTGTWSMLADAQRGVVPGDLRAALDAAPSATFDGWSHSARRAALEHLARAKRPATREQRIAEIVARATADAPARGRRPHAEPDRPGAEPGVRPVPTMIEPVRTEPGGPGGRPCGGLS
ncbi:YdeI family protein [Pseudonocardia sp. N23]|uniref:YdeI/OmpD-associated family protein n=1 Tax=Pseudonocardia sp. N23 TaxID=1987376 RepID=UPI000C02F664|nr:YdeI/OmpD-associated family protein [Pseudonocardia sp. N23]GAY09116.1 hypothetical protein TOK_3072 [Pseudonocardia sp. N23]